MGTEATVLCKQNSLILFLFPVRDAKVDIGVPWNVVMLICSGHWAIGHMSIERAHWTTPSASILDFAVSEKNPPQGKEKERKKGAK